MDCRVPLQGLAMTFLILAFEAFAEGTTLAKGMAELVLFESFTQVLGGWRVENFCEALFCNVSEGDLTAVIETAGDYAPVVQNSHVRV